MKLKRLAALVLAVMMTLAAASVTGLSKLAAEGTQKPEKSVVDAAGATWYHADAGEELRFDDDSSYCFESESWIMRQKSGNTIDEAVFDGITPDNVQTLTDENGETKPLTRGRIKLEVEGGDLLAFGSACPYYPESYQSAETDTYYGEALAIVRMGDGDAMTIAASDGEYSAELTVPAQA